MFREEKILLVDDEQGLLDLLKMTFEKERYRHITCVSDPVEALALVRENTYDIILLDVMMPGFSGFELCSELRKYTFAPILFLTACNSDFDKLQGLAIGGDDYITKPFNPLEVVARVNAALLRQKQYQSGSRDLSLPTESILDYGVFQISEERAVLTVQGQPVECTAKEFDLLLYFCKNPNRVFTTSQIYEAVWGNEAFGDEKTVSVHILKLRRKLGDDAKSPTMLINMRGIGYKFIPPGGIQG